MSTPFVGEVRLFGFGFAPVGWLSCNGSLVSISQYDTLFALIGTTYGGDGVETFGLPDLRGQVPVHQGTGPGLSTRVIGEFGGSENVTLLAQNVPAHSHGFNATTLAATANSPGATLELGAVSGDTLYATDTTGGSVTLAPSTTPSGDNQPHDNLMPTLTVQFCIATDGLFPTQN